MFDSRALFRTLTGDHRADRCSDTLRRVSHDLHPTTLPLVGLASALKGHCSEVEQRHPVQVQFRADGDLGGMRPDVVVCLFRIAQESMRNAIVHGGAKRLAVSVARAGDHVELSVTDDGCGFDVDDVRRTGGGLGLVSMEERARAVGADVQITSRVRLGTTIRVRGPVEPVEQTTMDDRLPSQGSAPRSDVNLPQAT